MTADRSCRGIAQELQAAGPTSVIVTVIGNVPDGLTLASADHLVGERGEQPGLLTNQATLSRGGPATANASDNTTILPAIAPTGPCAASPKQQRKRM